MNPRMLRRQFLTGLLIGLKVVWPVLSALLAVIVALGLLVGLCEGWSMLDSLYFAFVTGLTIGYGDLAPHTGFTRVLAILIGLCGALLIALFAAIAVKALTLVTEGKEN